MGKISLGGKRGNEGRIWEIDLLRGIALFLMVYFHLVYDLNAIYGYDVSYETGFNRLTGKAAGIIFVLVAGLSSNFSRNNLKRGLKVLGAAVLVTAGSYVYSPDYCILFGVLHFLGTSMVLYSLMSGLNWPYLAAIGIGALLAGTAVSRINLSHNFLLPLGFTTADFRSVDYYPLLPWFGVFLIGAAAGKLLYRERRSILGMEYRDNLVTKAGRHTLIIYLLHQPLMILMLEGFNWLKKLY